MKKWEYKLISEPPKTGMLEAIINNQGKEGWELVSSYFIPEESTPGIKSERIYCIFKRPN